MDLGLKILKPALGVLILSVLSVLTVAGLNKAEAFEVNVSQTKIDEIMRRVRAYQWHDAPTGAGWKYGADREFMKRLVAYWTTRYDWRKAEREINRFKQYRADINGQKLHFIYEKSSGKNPQPLLLLHGFPYSFYSFSEVIEPLAHPERFGGNAEDGFDVIVPSLPNYHFSDAPQDLQGLRSAANRIHRLMTDVLGYKKFVVQGGDHGDVIGLWMARDYPNSLLGLHENQLAVRNDDAAYSTGKIVGKSTAAERAFMAAEKKRFDEQSAYFLLQMTRAETLSMAMTDSPVGQAGWIVEKFYYWTDKTRLLKKREVTAGRV